MSTFITTSDVMRKAATDVENVRLEVNQNLTDIKRIVTNLSSHWAGNAQASFVKLMTEWDHNAKNLSEALQSIGRNITANAQAFDEQESLNANVFTKMAGNS
ncbi:MAG: WXG100 family type VII secretion target [Corynebacterium sp.]|nr:WXG100 family type VII secretion target [Corynebacterium sp.]